MWRERAAQRGFGLCAVWLRQETPLFALRERHSVCAGREGHTTEQNTLPPNTCGRSFFCRGRGGTGRQVGCVLLFVFCATETERGACSPPTTTPCVYARSLLRLLLPPSSSNNSVVWFSRQPRGTCGGFLLFLWVGRVMACGARA